MVSYVLVTFNTCQLTINAVKSIVDNCSDYEVIVVDNGSSDETVKELNKAFASEIKEQKVIVLDTKENNGFSKGNNIGAKASHGEYLIFINPDTITSSDLSKQLVEPLQSKYKGQDVLTAPKILNPDLTPQHSVNTFPMKGLHLFVKHLQNRGKDKKKAYKADWLTGVCYCVSRETYNKLGGWNEAYDLYSEDLDFCYRIRKQLKGEVIILNDVTIVHYGNQSGKTIYKTSFASYEKKMNSLRKFYSIYLDDKKFYKWLRFSKRFDKSEELQQYLDKYFKEA